MDKLNCIYKIVYLPTFEMYVGSTINYDRRKYAHISDLKANRHRNYKIQNLFNIKKDPNDFHFSVLEIVNIDNNIVLDERKKLLEKVEQVYLDSGLYKLNICEKSRIYNLGKTYEELYGINKANKIKNKIAFNNSKRIVTQETKDKISQSLKGRKLSKEIAYKCGNAFRGKKRPDISEKLSKSWTKERRVAHSLRMKGIKTESKRKVKVSNILTGIISIYRNTVEACEYTNLSRFDLYKAIKQIVKNFKVEFIYE